MNELLYLALSNLAVAFAIAAAALAADRLARRPALAHGLWVLFFLKLLTPPLLPVSMTWFMTGAAEIKVEPVAELLPLLAADPWQGNAEPADIGTDLEEVVVWAKEEVVNAPAAPPAQPLTEAVAELSAPTAWRDAWAGLWLLGSCAWLGLAGLRLWRFQRQVRFAHPANSTIRKAAQTLAQEMEVVCPGVWILPGPISPMLWVLGRKPRLFLPAGLVERLEETQWQAVVAHELAHWRRRDHWVRWLELAALTIYWWCPLVWWARRHLREVEEACCDAWVVWLMPAAARGYALALVETLEFMASARTALPPVASGIGHVRLLKRRLTMIMRGTTPRTLTGRGLAVLALAALALPLMPSWAQTQSADQPRSGRSASRSEPEVADKLQELTRAQQDIRRLQEELDRSREKLERLTRDLNSKMEQFRRQATEVKRQTAGAAGLTAENRAPTTPAARPGPGGFGGGGFAPGGFGGGGFGSASVGAPGFPGGGSSAGAGGRSVGTSSTGGMRGSAGTTPSNVDKRLREVERKLDLLIQMMRQGARPGAAAPGQRTSGNAIVPLATPQGLAPPGIGVSPPTPAAAPAIEVAPPAPEGVSNGVPAERALLQTPPVPVAPRRPAAGNPGATAPVPVGVP